MQRAANHAILGYQYQFQKTLLEILQADDDDLIIVEGVNEDIEKIDSHGNIKATQCKYHASAGKFEVNRIFSPVLHMLSHFANDPVPVCRYMLYVYFPDHCRHSRKLDTAEVTKTLASQNNAYKTRIDAIKSDIASSRVFCNEGEFIQKFCEVCTIEFGDSIEDLEARNLGAFRETHLPSDSIDTLYMSNAIQNIVYLSTKKNIEDRQVTKRQFLSELAEIRSVAITKWTLALKSRKRILAAKRNQLSDNLGQDSRERGIFLSDSGIRGFDEEIVKFIKSFVDQYNIETTQRHPPTFLLDCSRELFNEICQLLWKKRIRFEDGMIAEEFSVDKFGETFTYSLSTKPEEMSLRLRLCCTCWSRDVLSEMAVDDVYVIGDAEGILLPPTKSVDIEHLSVNTFDELKYLLGMKKQLPDY